MAGFQGASAKLSLRKTSQLARVRHWIIVYELAAKIVKWLNVGYALTKKSIPKKEGWPGSSSASAVEPSHEFCHRRF